MSDNEKEHFSMHLTKDVALVFFVVFFSLLFLTALYTETLHHTDNFVVSDRFTTPNHIVPEWYFLSYYAVLRSVASKSIGVIILLAVVLQILFSALCVVWASFYSPIVLGVDSCLSFSLFIIMGVLGGCLPVFPYVELASMFSVVLFGQHVLGC